jgi:PAS domain-containing protein
LLRSRPFRDFEYSRPGTDGTLRYISTSGTPVFDESGKFSGYHGVGRDITDRKRVEEELRSRQQMLEVAQKAARAAAFEWQVGAGLGTNRWSPDLEAMHGIPVGSYDGTYESWKRLVHPADWPNIKSRSRPAEQTGDVDAEYRVLHAGGVDPVAPRDWSHALRFRGTSQRKSSVSCSTSPTAISRRRNCSESSDSCGKLNDWRRSARLPGDRSRLQQSARRDTRLWRDGVR